MDSYREKAETLSRQFGISQSDAMKALEECDGDILDTVSSLECQGKIKRISATYNTERKTDPTTRSFHGDGCRAEYNTETDAHRDFSDFKEKALNLLKKSVEYKLTVFKDEKKIIELPIIVVAVMAIAAFWVTVPLLAVGLLAGCRYDFSAD